jgi:hypothetical protein
MLAVIQKAWKEGLDIASIPKQLDDPLPALDSFLEDVFEYQDFDPVLDMQNRQKKYGAFFGNLQKTSTCALAALSHSDKLLLP